MVFRKCYNVIEWCDCNLTTAMYAKNVYLFHLFIQ
jgi:hypothetical protein